MISDGMTLIYQVGLWNPSKTPIVQCHILEIYIRKNPTTNISKTVSWLNIILPWKEFASINNPLFAYPFKNTLICNQHHRHADVMLYFI